MTRHIPAAAGTAVTVIVLVLMALGGIALNLYLWVATS